MAQAVTPLIRDPQIDALKLPPYSVEAEQSVLGGLLLDNTAWEKIADLLTDADFYRAKLASARFYAEHVAPMALAYARIAKNGIDSVVGTDAALIA